MEKTDQIFNKMDIEIGNKLIAEFMGGKYYPKVYSTDNQIISLPGWRNVYVDSLKYHKSWDWLMPVIQKIKDIILTEFSYKIKLDEVDVLNLYITAPITIVWEYAIYFIKMYNNQKQ